MDTTPQTSIVPTVNPNSISDYFNNSNSAYYVIYNSADGKWYTGNGTPTPVTSTSLTSNPGYTIFKNPMATASNIPSLSINSIGSVYTPASTGTITLQLGASLALSYQISNVTWPTEFQLVLANRTIATILYNPSSSPNTGTLNFTVFGDITVTAPTLFLTSYNTFGSNPIPVYLDTSNSLAQTLSTSSSSVPSSVTITNTTNPAINITAPNNDSIIRNLNITYSTMTSNEYFMQFTLFTMPLIISKTNLTFGTTNFESPFMYLFYTASEGFSNITNATEMYLKSKKNNTKSKLTNTK
jgi:hypothetical protein